MKLAIKRNSYIVHTLDDLSLRSLCGKHFDPGDVRDAKDVDAGKWAHGWRDCLRCVES